MRPPYQIFANEKGKLLLYPDNLSITELAKKYQMLKAELQMLKYLTAEDVIAKAALHVRADVIKQDFPQVWPPMVVEAEESGPIIPESLTLFLQYFLTGIKDNGHASQRV